MWAPLLKGVSFIMLYIFKTVKFLLIATLLININIILFSQLCFAPFEYVPKRPLLNKPLMFGEISPNLDIILHKAHL